MTGIARTRTPGGIGLYLAAVQFLLALGWIVYAIYLPQLARASGLEARWVPLLLMVDQLVFIVTDLAVGMASDRAAQVLGRIGRAVVAATLLSTAAFLAMPFAAGSGSPVLLIGASLVWAVSSSALRAPPLTLLGRYVAVPAQPMMVSLGAFGIGVAGALAPYLGLALQRLDPRGPFLLSGLSLAAVTLGMVAAERALARQRRAADPAGVPDAAAASQPPATAAALAPAFLLACTAGALAFQWHAFVASAPLALRLAAPADLPWLLPAFWVGFNLALVPAGLWSRRQGPWRTLVLGAALAALGNALASLAPGLTALVAGQATAGAGWGVLLCSAFSAALLVGQGGREGLLSGALSSTLAAAALLRIGYVSTQAPPPALAADRAWLGALGFALCALVLWRVLRQVRQRRLR